MPPLRRYLRITPRSVLETRIYLDNPTDLHRWLLHSATPALPAVIEAIRPLVLPKLREENDIARGKVGKKGKKKGGVKDTVVRDDFEVAIFLTRTNTRHSILRKSKQIKSEYKPLGNKPRLTNLGTRADKPLDVDKETPVLMSEDSDEDAPMANIPPVLDRSMPPTLEREDTINTPDDADNSGAEGASEGDEQEDEKKKMGFKTDYEGFAIYGRILCLVVKRRTTNKARDMPGGAGQAMMEEWIGTQVQREEDGVVDEG